MIPDAYLFLRDEIITDKVCCHRIVGCDETVGPPYGTMHPEMVKMTAEPPIMVISILQKTKVFDFDDSLAGNFINILLHG